MGTQLEKFWMPAMIVEVIAVVATYVGVLAALMYQVASAAGFLA